MRTSELNRKQLDKLFRYWDNSDLRYALATSDSDDYRKALRRELIENRNAKPDSI